MNAKKAKRLRQLVHHLMGQGAIAGNGWMQYNTNVRFSTATETIGSTTNEQGEKVTVTKESIYRTTSKDNTYATGPVTLDPACGRAIYQQMKKRTLTHSTR